MKRIVSMRSHVLCREFFKAAGIAATAYAVGPCLKAAELASEPHEAGFYEKPESGPEKSAGRLPALTANRLFSQGISLTAPKRQQ